MASIKKRNLDECCCFEHSILLATPLPNRVEFLKGSAFSGSQLGACACMMRSLSTVPQYMREGGQRLAAKARQG